MSYKDGVALLKIVEVHPEDEGLYTCNATNQSGSSSETCDLYVEGEENSG